MRALVQGIVDEVNARFATVEQVKKFRMLPKELDHEDGELTATQKVKRTAIATMFADLVESMYRRVDDRVRAVPGARAGRRLGVRAAGARLRDHLQVDAA